MAAAAAVVTVALAPDHAEPLTQTASRAPAGDAAIRNDLDALPSRATLGKPAGELFREHSWEPKAVPTPAAARVVDAPADAPRPPPMPYRVAGRLVNADGVHVILARGDVVLPVREGDSLEGGYRVEAVADAKVTLLNVPLNVRQELPIAGTLAFDAPPAAVALASLPQSATVPAGSGAQLRWEGPRQVRAGETFDVALRLTSQQAVRASPVQLRFDAKLLQPVGVRAGDFFSDGIFSYRVNPAGSIFVGAAGKGAVPADAELVVITFKPVQGGATAELKVSSLVLQGTAGAITHEHPAAFRTAISQ